MKAPFLISLLLVSACSNEGPPAGSDLPHEPLATGPLAASLIVSDPVSNGPGATSRGYVSLPPGNIPGSAKAYVTNHRTGQLAAPTVIAGGFDPVPIVLEVGDTVDVHVTDGEGLDSHTEIEAVANRPPRLLRTSPPKGRTDVPLNLIIVIVISEPVDPASITSSSVALQLGNQPVPGALSLDSTGTVILLAPSALLSPHSTYVLEITGAVRDRSGAGLEGPATVTFTTGSDLAISSVTVTPQVTDVLSSAAGNSVLRNAQLSATALDSTGAPVLAGPITWSSEHPSLAQVSADGKVIGLAPGRAMIGAEVSGHKAGASVYVLDPLTAIDLGGLVQVAMVTSGQTCFRATPMGGDGPAGGYELVWELPAFLTIVRQEGNQVCAGAQEVGTGVITLRAKAVHAGWMSPVTASIRVTVTPAMQPAFNVNPWSATVRLGDSVPYGAFVADTDRTHSYRAAWSSANPDIATIELVDSMVRTPAGVWSGAKLRTIAPGAVMISATINDKTVSVPVTVIPAPPLPSGLVFSTVAPGSSHTCGIITNGSVYCWGDGRFGELGDNTTASSTIPVRVVVGGAAIVQVDVGGDQACGVSGGGALACWPNGSNGDPYRKTDYSTVSVGMLHGCVVDRAGAAFCWGGGGYGELGIGPVPTPPSCVAYTVGQPGWCTSLNPVAGGLAFASVSVGHYVTCGLSHSGEAFCWGDNRWGALGVGTSSGPEQCAGGAYDDYIVPSDPPTLPCSRSPTRTAEGLRFLEIRAMQFAVCGLAVGGRVYCWGRNDSGQLGIGSTSGPERCELTFGDGSTFSGGCSPTPVPVTGGHTFVRLSSAGSHSCALTETGEAYCWGSNDYGQLGNGTTVSSPVPTLVAGGLHFASIAAGEGEESCGITTTGMLYCWGNNGDGQLGTGGRGMSTVPVPVMGQP